MVRQVNHRRLSSSYCGIGKRLDILLEIRKNLNYIEQYDYFNDKKLIGLTREGIDELDSLGLVVVLTNRFGR